MKSLAQLENIISKHFKVPYNELFKQLILPSIRIKSSKNDLIPFGSSKFGGNPQVSKLLDWPYNENGYPLTFLCQINLSEIDIKLLPSKGFLYFFFDWREINLGHVIYVENDAVNFVQPMPLINREYNLKSLFVNVFKKKVRVPRIRECKCVFSVEYFIPSQDSVHFDLLNKQHNIQEVPNSIYRDELIEDNLLADKEDSEYTPQHRMLGNYSGIQNEYLETSFIKSNITDRLDYYQEAAKWKLLLQLDTDQNLKFSWGDGGRIYFFIHEDDLLSQDFTRVKVTGDCY